MTTRPIIYAAAAFCLVAPSYSQAESGEVGKALANTYSIWRNSMVRKDYGIWQRATAPHRQAEVRNRLVSEKRPFPGAIFDVPVPPPSLDGLKLLHVSVKGATAKGAWFGPIDFGGNPTENIIVVSFIHVSGAWRYDKADFVNLVALPDVRKELAKGDLSYISQTPEFQATGVVPVTPVTVGGAKYIAKVYVFCPGREVQVQVNNVSRHRFANAQEAEVVIGGAKDGINTVTYTAKSLQGATGEEALAIRVYLMSEIQGTQPVKAWEYRVDPGGAVKGSATATFQVDAATAVKLVPQPGR